MKTSTHILLLIGSFLLFSSVLCESFDDDQRTCCTAFEDPFTQWFDYDIGDTIRYKNQFDEIRYFVVMDRITSDPLEEIARSCDALIQYILSDSENVGLVGGVSVFGGLGRNIIATYHLNNNPTDSRYIHRVDWSPLNLDYNRPHHAWIESFSLNGFIYDLAAQTKLTSDDADLDEEVNDIRTMITTVGLGILLFIDHDTQEVWTIVRK